MKTKKGIIMVLAMALTVFAFSANAQEAEASIEDDALYRYALMQEVVALMKKDISTEVNKMIKAQEGMTGQRYKELSMAKGNEDKLAAANVQEWELKFLKQIDDFKAERIDAIKVVNTELATKMVGDKGKSYKAIKEELAGNADLKARYDDIAASLKESTD